MLFICDLEICSKLYPMIELGILGCLIALVAFFFSDYELTVEDEQD
jgi:hypothetical protein